MSRREAGYEAWLDDLDAGDGYALVCPAGHGSVPPRRVCPTCGSRSLSTEPLAATGVIETLSVVHVPSPQFAADAPYVTAIADFGPVRLTGVISGLAPERVTRAGADAPADGVGVGTAVTVGAETRETDGEQIVSFALAADG